MANYQILTDWQLINLLTSLDGVNRSGHVTKTYYRLLALCAPEILVTRSLIFSFQGRRKSLSKAASNKYSLERQGFKVICLGTKSAQEMENAAKVRSSERQKDRGSDRYKDWKTFLCNMLQADILRIKIQHYACLTNVISSHLCVKFDSQSDQILLF